MAGYRTIHAWVNRHYQKTGTCQVCHQHVGTKGRAGTHWANVSGEYRREDRTDWRELCPRCHKRLDSRASVAPPTHCASGRHLLSPDNIYFRSNGAWDCRSCARESRERWVRKRGQTLTLLEQRVLSVLAWANGKPLDEHALQMWALGYSAPSASGTVRAYIRSIRRKLGADAIVNQRKLGYRLGPIKEEP